MVGLNELTRNRKRTVCAPRANETKLPIHENDILPLSGGTKSGSVYSRVLWWARMVSWDNRRTTCSELLTYGNA